jgi:hypothetical protein
MAVEPVPTSTIVCRFDVSKVEDDEDGEEEEEGEREREGEVEERRSWSQRR